MHALYLIVAILFMILHQTAAMQIPNDKYNVGLHDGVQTRAFNRFPNGWTAGETISFRIQIADDLCLKAIDSNTASLFLQQGNSIIKKQRKYRMLNVQFRQESESDIYTVSAKVPLVMYDSIYRVRVVCSLGEIEHDGIDYTARFMLSNSIRVRPPVRNTVYSSSINDGRGKGSSYARNIYE